MLVVQELRQAKQMTGAELIGTNYVAFAEREVAILGEQLAGAIVRSCIDPSSVTDEDTRVLASYYQQLLFLLSGMLEVEMVGEFGTERSSRLDDAARAAAASRRPDTLEVNVAPHTTAKAQHGSQSESSKGTTR
jgi:hypothetical protein